MPTSPPGTSKRGSPRKGRNKWTYEQRVCLDILWTLPNNPSPNERTHAFNTIFKDHLIAYGFPGGLAHRVLASQYRVSKQTHESTWAATWGRVCAIPKYDTLLREQLQSKIGRILMGGGNTTQDVAGPATPPTTPPMQQGMPTPSASVKSSGKRQANVPLRYREEPLVTPSPSTRKRPATTPEMPLIFDEDDEDYEPGPKRARNARSPVVELPSTPPQSIVTTPVVSASKTGKSPKRKYRSGGRPGADWVLHRFDGSTLKLYEPEWRESQLPLQVVSEALAHPKTGPAIVFRYWDSKSHGRNSPDGFVCGRYMRAILDPGPPPPTRAIIMNDIAQHLNNAGMDQTGTPSPFISASNILIWVIANKMLKKGKATGHISVIDTSKLRDPKRSMFWIPPFYKEIKKQRPLTKGDFNYQGSHEHLIWDRIPAEAVIKTFSLSDLTAFADSSDVLRAVLRLEKLRTKYADLPKDLKRDNIAISSRVAEAIAQIVLFLGLDHKSSLETLTAAVSEVAQGWCLRADGSSQETAGAFIQVFCRKSEKYIEMKEQFKLRHAFLSGLQWSCGDLNARLKGPEAYAKMNSNAAKKGLVPLLELLSRDLDDMKLKATVHEQAQDRLHAAPLGIEGLKKKKRRRRKKRD